MTTDTPHCQVQVKQHLHLPNTNQGWEEANFYFAASLIPAVVAAPSPEEMNQVLVEGVYNYFATTHGTKKIRVQKKKLHSPHNRPLKKKSAARKELRLAQKQGYCPEAIQAISRESFSLVHCHSRLKKSSQKVIQSHSVRGARQQCHQHFSKFAKEVLDGTKTSRIVPALIGRELIVSSQRCTMLSLGTMSSQHGCLPHSFLK